MLVIAVRFDQKRFHATPWDNQVNEGLVEWPPSPWRLLRAIVSSAFSRVDADESQAEALVDALAQAPPTLHVRAATVMQTRHYMPKSGLGKADQPETTKILDTAAALDAIPDDAAHAAFAWEGVTLDTDAMATLDAALAALTFLGRSESWATLWRADGVPYKDEMIEVRPEDDEAAEKVKGEYVAVPWPLSGDALQTWRARWASEEAERSVRADRAKAEAKGSKFNEKSTRDKALAKALSSLPATVLAVVSAETAELQKAGWSRPPGTTTLRYVRPTTVLGRPRTRRRDASVGETVTTARFLLAARVLPNVRYTLPFAETVRAAILRWTDDALGANDTLDVRIVAGHDNTRTPAQGHEHVHVFCEPHRERPWIASFTVHVPAGMPPAMEQALRRPGRSLNDPNERPRRATRDGDDTTEEGVRLPVVLAGIGTAETLGGRDADLGQTATLGAGRTWVSITPFVGTQHRKPGKPATLPEGLVVELVDHLDPAAPGARTRLYGAGDAAPEGARFVCKGDAVAALLHQLDANGFPPPRHVLVSYQQPLPTGTRLPCSQYITRRRRGDGVRGSSPPVAFYLAFDEPVQGPIALGYGAHYGLGVFRVV